MPKTQFKKESVASQLNSRLFLNDNFPCVLHVMGDDEQILFVLEMLNDGNLLSYHHIKAAIPMLGDHFCMVSDMQLQPKITLNSQDTLFADKQDSMYAISIQEANLAALKEAFETYKPESDVMGADSRVKLVKNIFEKTNCINQDELINAVQKYTPPRKCAIM